MRSLTSFSAVAAIVLFSGCPLSGVPEAPAERLDSNEQPLDDLVDRTLRENRHHRQLSANLHGGWQVMHGVLAYGRSLEIETSNGTQPAVEYLLSGGELDGFQPVAGDDLGDPPRPGLFMEVQPTTKIGQGHYDQWLAVMSQTGLPSDAPIRSDGHTFTMLDWVRQAEHDVPRNFAQEFSWTLIGLTRYRSTAHRWTARDGRSYSIESLLEAELTQSLESSVCGGTHRLIGIAMALDARRNEGLPIVGVWADAKQVLARAIVSARENQNADGSFSVAYLHRPGLARDLGETLGTTGHVLEFLTLTASDQTLRQAWVRRSVRHLCEVLEQCQTIDLECGVLYHALHGLHEYQRRMTEDST